MIKIRTGGLIFILIACFFYACDSTTSGPTETVPPTIQLDDPDSNSIIMNDDTIRFTGTINDNDRLHSMLLTIQGMQGQVYYTYNPTVDGLSTYHFDTPWFVYGIPYDTIGYLNLIVIDQSENYAQKHWYMRLRD
jgi:hypothetical protein